MNTEGIEFCQGCNKKLDSPEFHPCPFAQEIWGDDEPDCNCCEDCEEQCASDI